MFIRIFFIISLFLSSLEAVKKYVVCVPVANLRSEPIAAPKGVVGPALSRDLGRRQETQLLFGERLEGEPVEGSSDWLLVSSQDQLKWRDEQWKGYKGYVLASSVAKVDNFGEVENKGIDEISFDWRSK